MELTTFTIPTFRKETVQKRLEKLVKKANKYGNENIKFSWGEPKLIEVKTDNGTRQYEFIDITISGSAPKISGWELLARVEMFGDENLIHSVPGSEVSLGEHFREHNGSCDHCKTARRRNDVYVLTDGNQQIAVGRTCLRDFLGIDDPKSIIARAQFFEELRDIEKEDDFSGFGSFGYLTLKEVLVISAAFIRKDGYVSKAKQQETGYSTTGECVKNCIAGFTGYEIETTDADIEWAEKTIKFFRGNESFGNDYMDNIRVIMKQDIVKKEHVGIVASSVLAAQRALSPKPEKTESNFIGEVKQRLKGIELLLEKIIFLGHGSFGPSFLHLMKDDAGNQFSWITGNKLEVAEGTRIKLDATVKQHKLYNDVKQTVLTRAKQLENV